MKKLVLAILAVLLATALAGCGAKKGVCANCGQTEVLKEFTDSYGNTSWYCEDCYTMAKLLS